MTMRTEEEIRANIIEQLAELEHEQWAAWADSLLHSDGLSVERIDRWHTLIRTDYADLTEEEKNKDRIWAERAYEICAQTARVLNDKEG